jgi:hypothetical protein
VIGVPADEKEGTSEVMKLINLPVAIAILIAATEVAHAGHKVCCVTYTRCCTPLAGGKVSRWYRAKDGSLREQLSYEKALSRAEDADDLERALKSVREELAQERERLSAVANAAESARAAVESQVAALQDQLKAAMAESAAQRQRAETAEAAHKLAVESAAALRDEARRREDALAGLKAELKAATEEIKQLRDAAAAGNQPPSTAEPVEKPVPM